VGFIFVPTGPRKAASASWRFAYLLNFFHDFTKINEASKDCQNYTIAAIPYGGGGQTP
jgi:hypothetical protein